MPVLIRIAAGCMVGLAVAGCTSPSPGHPHYAVASPSAGLSEMGQSASDYSYTLTNLNRCQVSDAISIIANQAKQPARITDVSVDISGDSPGVERRTFEIAALKAGTSTGELAASSHLAAIAGDPVRQAAGAILQPASSSGLWYDVIVRLAISGLHPRPWSIDRITVDYRLGDHLRSLSLRQSIHLSPIKSCR